MSFVIPPSPVDSPFGSYLWADWYEKVRRAINGVTGTIPATQGGTGFTSYAVGDMLYANTATTLAKLPISTNGFVLTIVSGVPAWQASSGGGYCKGAAWTGGGAAIIATGTDVVFGEAQSTGTIKSITLLGTGAAGAVVSGSCSVEVWKVAYASAPPSSANKISPVTAPAISASNKFQDTTLTGWTTAVTKGDIFAFKLLTSSTFCWVEVVLEIA